TDGAKVSFDFAMGFAPVTRAVTASGTLASATLSYRDVHGITRIDRATTPFNSFRAMPADKLGDGLNRLSIADGSGTNVIRYFKDPVDQQVTVPAPIQLAQQPTATKLPYPNVHFVVPVQAGTIYDLSFGTTNMTTMSSRSWSVEMTSAWLAKAFPGAMSFDYTAPDLSGVAGWKTEFQPEAGLPLDWSVGTSKNVNVDWFPSLPPGTMCDHDGSELTISSVNGQGAAP